MASNEDSRSAIEQVRAPKMADLVAKQLRRQIISGALRDGDALPTETELLEQFGVSRPTLREALRVLESEQLIEIRRGARGGARVRIPTADVAAKNVGLLLQLRGTTLADVLNARELIEQHCAPILARKRTKSDLARLWKEVEHGESAVHNSRELIHVHADFHGLVVELAGNETLRILYGLLREIVEAGTYTRIAEERTASYKGASSHRHLVEAIEARDADAARELWRTHLSEVSKYVSGGSAKTVIDLFDYV
ncbi:FadR/GntR family transcriptional regulator [Nocardioides sp. WS12]|uniref:FadR/GntR family transcriptional regulator n=1 Tax=Nocardioides sp. WS12 TaxID=2486272 RepID=UPI00191F05B1|nr:FadR/GntR family transcriptional regulator [Nocardioides sp. WS12]